MLTKKQIKEQAPSWWKLEGAEVEVKEVNYAEIYMASRSVRIWLNLIPLDERKVGLTWMWTSVVRSSPLHTLRLQIPMGGDDLRSMFGLFQIMGNNKGFEHVDLDSYVGGVFVRKGVFASVPCFGARVAGDPCVCFMVKDGMQNLVDNMVSKHE